MTKSKDTHNTPTPASTVILTREAGSGIEVYLLKRSSKSGFMPGDFVFPGGTVDNADLAPGQWEAHIDKNRKDISRDLGGSLAVDEVMGYGIAAIRETFEEAGVFLAHQGDERKNAYKKISEVRTTRGLAEGWLAESVRSDGWTLTFSRLGRWSHWITPKGKKQRFDTRFFITPVPKGQECTPDGHETTQGIWISPEEALAGNLKGRIPLSPPTLVTLNELFQFPDMETLAKEAETRTWGKPRQPRLLRSSKDMAILLPWDPMRNKEGEVEIKGSENKILPIGAPFSRLWNHQGIWKPLGNS